MEQQTQKELNGSIVYECPRCEGRGVVIGRCCAGLSNECGCMGLPVDMDCGLCDDYGHVYEQPTEAQVLEYAPFVEEQRELAKDMQAMYEQHKEKKQS